MMVERSEGPLTIEGFSFRKALGAFSIGDSYLYLQEEGNRVVHVLLARSAQNLDEFIAEFSQIVGDQAANLVLFAGLTDMGKPYLVTDFLDEEPVTEAQEIADETRVSARSPERDETRLSASRVPLDDTVLSSRTNPARTSIPTPSTRSAPPSKRISIPSLVVTERQAVIPDPSAPADTLTYAPRQIPIDTDQRAVHIESRSVRASAPRVNRLARERDRARVAIIAVAGSVVASVIGAAALLWFLVGQ